MSKILIVEDNAMNMRLFSDLLKSKKYTVIECIHGNQALAIVQKEKPDLVLMDIQMPEISGLEVTRQIRETPDIARTKIIAVSAFAMEGDGQRMIEAGCDDYISKPISIVPFFTTVEKYL